MVDDGKVEIRPHRARWYTKMKLSYAMLLTAALSLVGGCEGEDASRGARSSSRGPAGSSQPPTQTAQEWPELTVEELDVVSEISG